MVPGRSSGYRQVVVFVSFPESAAKFMLNENVSVSVLGIVLNQRAFGIFLLITQDGSLFQCIIKTFSPFENGKVYCN